MLTNFRTIQTRIARLNEIEDGKQRSDGAAAQKEQSSWLKRRQSLSTTSAVSRNMKKVPGIMFVVDPRKEHNTIHEARSWALR